MYYEYKVLCASLLQMSQTLKCNIRISYKDQINTSYSNVCHTVMFSVSKQFTF